MREHLARMGTPARNIASREDAEQAMVPASKGQEHTIDQLRNPGYLE